MKKQYVGWILLCPTLILFAIFAVYPLFQAIYLSFFRSGPFIHKYIGLKNFITIFENPVIRHSFWVTLQFILVGVPFLILIPLFAAIFVARLAKFWQVYVRFAFYIPQVAAGIVISLMWRWIFHPNGMLNWLLNTKILWLASMPYSFIAICIALVTSQLGVNTIIIMACLGSVDESLYEAAILDGCTAWQEARYVTVPLIKNIIGYLTLVGIIAVSQIWMYPFFLTDGGPVYSTTPVVLLIYNTAFHYGRYGEASAIGVILMVMVTALASLQLKSFKEFKV